MAKSVKGTPRRVRPFTSMIELNLELIEKKRQERFGPKTPTSKPTPKRRRRRKVV